MFRIHKAVDDGRRWSLSTGARCCARWVLFLFCAVASPSVCAQHEHAHDHGAAAPHGGQPTQASLAKGPGVIAVGPARVALADVEVLDQDGRQLRFYSDLFKGRVVVVSVFFTSCTLVCPMQARVLTRLKAELGPRLGRDVFFISISRDPETDTPARLKRWGTAYGVGPGWTLVTGKQFVMNKLLLDFTGGGPGSQLHSPVLLIGNDRTGVWTATDGLAPIAELIKVIDKVSSGAQYEPDTTGARAPP